MPGFSRDINRLARGTPAFDIIEGYEGFSLHYRPMLFTPKMFLITESFPWPHSEPLDFIRRGIQEHLPMSPGRSRMVGTRFFLLQELNIDLDVRLDHTVLKAICCHPVTAVLAAYSRHLGQTRDSRSHIRHHIPGFSMAHDVCHGLPGKRHHGCATGERLKGTQALHFDVTTRLQESVCPS